MKQGRPGSVTFVLVLLTVNGTHALTPVVSAAPAPRGAVVCYLTSRDSTARVPEEAFPSYRIPAAAWQWRVFDPATLRDTLVFALPSFPTRIRWSPGFDSVEFVLASRIVSADWRVGARLIDLARLPSDTAVCQVWRDMSNRWHVTTRREKQTPVGEGRVGITQITTRWDLDSSGQWRMAVVDSIGDYDEGCFAISERLQRNALPAASITMEALLDSMRIGSQRRPEMRDLPPAARDADPRVFLPAPHDSSVGVEMTVGFGDSEHAMAPVIWVDRRRGARKTVFTDSDWGQTGQVGFSQRGNFLLMAEEFSGTAPTVVDLRTGRGLLRVITPSARAVWVLAPR